MMDFQSLFDKLGGSSDSTVAPADEPEASGQQDSPAEEGGLDSPSVLESAIYALTGNPDSDLTPDQLAARNGRRADAGAMAASYKNPGKSFMQPVSGGGGNPLESIGKVLSLFGVGG